MKLFVHVFLLYIQLKLYKTVNPMSRIYLFNIFKTLKILQAMKKRKEIKKNKAIRYVNLFHVHH